MNEDKKFKNEMKKKLMEKTIRIGNRLKNVEQTKKIISFQAEEVGEARSNNNAEMLSSKYPGDSANNKYGFAGSNRHFDEIASELLPMHLVQCTE